MDYRNCTFWSLLFTLVGVLLMFLSMVPNPPAGRAWLYDAVFPVEIVLLFVGVLIRVIFWRRPHCRVRLPWGFSGKERRYSYRCTSCGKEIKDL